MPGVDVGGAWHADAVGEQGGESRRGHEASLNWLAGQDEADIDPAGGAGLQHRELRTP
jgi:hypothetical protein